MIGPRWRKVAGDLWGNKTRTFLVVLCIAVGIVSVGVMVSARTVTLRELRASYDRINPHSATLTTQRFGDDLVQAVQNMDGIQSAEGRGLVTARLKLPSGETKDLALTMIKDFGHMTINKIWPVSGAWPPQDHELLLERAALNFIGANIGDTLTVYTSDNKPHEMRISGTTFNVNLAPVQFSSSLFGAINQNTLEWLSGSGKYNSLSFVVAENPQDKAHVEDMVNRVVDRFEQAGVSTYSVWVPTPGRHPADEIVSPVMLLFQVMGFTTLLLSCLLVINTISSVLAEQVRQMGMMKAIGARRIDLVWMYLTSALVYGVLALLFALPLGLVGAWFNIKFMADMLNLDISNWMPPMSAVILQVALAVGLPLVAALFPIFKGTGLSVREAVNDYGVTEYRTSPGLFARLLDRQTALSRIVILALRNTFRRKGRVIRTVVVLALAGAMFIAVVSVRESAFVTLNQAQDYYQYDAQYGLAQSVSFDTLSARASQVSGVRHVEGWLTESANRKYADGRISRIYPMVALPPDTKLVQPIVVEGRWLNATDENAVVIDTTVLREEPDLHLGDSLTMKVNNEETTWRVVGIVRSALDDALYYVPYSYVAGKVHQEGRVNRLLVQTDPGGVDAKTAVATSLLDRLESDGISVQALNLTSTIQHRVKLSFDVLVIFLLVMSVMLALVGGLGLVGTMSINVLERTREVGVMRAIGASTAAIFEVVCVEGMAVGFISWVLASVAAWPASELLNDGVGNALLRFPLGHTYSISGLFLWLLLVEGLTVISCILPATRAARLSVRQVLTYE